MAADMVLKTGRSSGRWSKGSLKQKSLVWGRAILQVGGTDYK